MMIIISSCSVLIVLTFIECSASQNVFVVSGEGGNETRLKVQNDSYECVLPQFPENGIWTILNGNGGPGNKVEEDTILKFVCNPGFILTSEYPYMICDRHGFPKDIPQCLRSPTYGYEHPENVTRSKRQYDSFKCTLPPFPENGKWTIINGDGRPGQEVEVDTGLKFQCHPGYKLTPKHPYIICDTNWSPELMPKCLMCSMSSFIDAGKSVEGKVNILQDVVVQQSELPQDIVDLTEFQLGPPLSLLSVEVVLVTADPKPGCSWKEDVLSTTPSSETKSTAKVAKKGSKIVDKRAAPSGCDDDFAAPEPVKKRRPAAKPKQVMAEVYGDVGRV
nr:uncharacterized protein LOC111512929 [Leptinotarsa decemlineata]